MEGLEVKKSLGAIIQELDKLMIDIDYGTFDSTGNELTVEEDIVNNATVQSPIALLKNKKGNCVDQTNFICNYLKNNGIKPKVYLMEYDDNCGQYPSVMFTTFDYDDKVYWYENAWTEQKGIHEFNLPNECLTFVKLNFCPMDNMDSCKTYEVKNLGTGLNPFFDLKTKQLEFETLPKFYFVSNKELEEAIPTIPNNYLVECGYEDYRQERVPLYLNIDYALSSIDNIKPNDEYYVYMPTELKDTLLYVPDEKEAPKSSYNREIWYLGRTPLKKLCKIKIDSEIDCNIDYDYGKIKKWNYTSDTKLHDAQSLKELEQRLKKSGRGKKEAHMAALSIRSKQLQQEKAEEEQLARQRELIKKEPRMHIVVNENGDVKFKGYKYECEDYEKAHSDEKFMVVPVSTYSMLSEEDIRDYFRDSSPKGLNIEFYRTNDSYVIEVKNSNKVITSEKCYDKKELTDSICKMRRVFKINKVEEKRI